MKTCPHCKYRLSFWRIKCRVCRNNVWRLNQIAFLTIIGLILVPTLMFSLLDGSDNNIQSLTNEKSRGSTINTGSPPQVPNDERSVQQQQIQTGNNLMEQKQKMGTEAFNKRMERAKKNRGQ